MLIRTPRMRRVPRDIGERDPSDAYTAIGLQGQYIYIDPATRTVVVKLS
jgi:CubicO group peptidase (beta-lactamase class C family)